MLLFTFAVVLHFPVSSWAADPNESGSDGGIQAAEQTEQIKTMDSGVTPVQSAEPDPQTSSNEPPPSVDNTAQTPPPTQEKAATPTPPPPPSKVDSSRGGIIIQWIDVKGIAHPGPAVKKLSWIWSRVPEEAFDSPALRLWLTARLPADWIPQKITGDGLSLVSPYTPGSLQNLIVDLRSGRAILRFEFIDGKGQNSEMTLLIQASMPRPKIIIHTNCRGKELKFKVDRQDAKHLFVGMNCIDLGDSMDLFFFRSKDSKWNLAPDLVQFDPKGEFTAFKFHAPKPVEQTTYERTLFRVGTLDEPGRATEYSIIYSPKIPPKRLYASAGVGFSLYDYKEQVDALNLKQISFTGKVSAGYRLIPKLLDVAFNFFGNVVSLYHTPKSYLIGDALPSARFYGFNGRLGYRLPIALGATEFMFLTGWYFWSMIVPENPNGLTYGISGLSGPQVFVTVLNQQKGKRAWWMYFKYAFITDKFKFLDTGHELAAGGGIEIYPKIPKFLSATVDCAYTTFANSINGFKLFSITFGVQKPF